jgi:hypothetical protein
MKELFVMYAKSLTKEQCIQKLSESLAEYNEAKMLGKELKQEESNLFLKCHMVLLNALDGNATDVLNQMEMVNKSVNFFKTDKN